MAGVAATTPLHALRVVAADIKIAHSVFALPFGILGAFMAAAPHGSTIQWRRFAGQLLLVVLAMVFARTYAMLANRLLDAEIDRANPRTSGRALPSARLTRRAAGLTLAGSAACFMMVCIGFGLGHGNWWPATLGGPVLAWLALYPLLKRFTALCHLYLGASLAISPVAAAIAVDPGAIAGQPSLWLLAGMVLCWVAGFDVIYALQDIAIDRATGLHSIPALLGTRGALWVSRLLHAAAAGFLIAAVVADRRFAHFMPLGAAIVVVLLLVEHVTVARWGTSRLALSFLTLNGVISCVLGVLGLVDVLSA